MHRQSRTKPTTQRNTRQHLQKTRTERKRNPTHGISAICWKAESNNGKDSQIKIIEAKTLTHFCCECSFSNVQIEITEDLRKRLSELKAPMAFSERKNREIPENKVWCSLWRLAVDPLDKACYKWKKDKPKSSRAFSLSLSSPQSRNVESQNIL